VAQTKTKAHKGRENLPRGVTMFRGRYRVRVQYDGRQVAVGVYDTLTDAKAARTAALAQIASGAFILPSQRRAQVKAQEEAARVRALTVREWSDTWMESLQRDGRTEGTLRAYRSLLDVHVLPALGDMALADVTEDDVNALVDQLKALPSQRHKGARTNGVWANVTRTLRSMFHAAVLVHAGGIGTSPVVVSIPKSQRVEKVEEDTDVATPAEVQQLADAMPEHLRIAVLLSAWCALRLGEVLGLQRRDLVGLDEPGKARLYVRRQWNTKASPARYTDPKAGSARSVSIPASLVPDIVAHLDQYVDAGPAAPVVTAQRYRDRPCSQTVFDKAWRTAREGVRTGFRFHALRHTSMTLYGQQGATIKELMDRAGHRSPDMVLRYQHSTKDRDRAMTDRLDDVVRAARTASAHTEDGE
jgi:integrase